MDQFCQRLSHRLARYRGRHVIALGASRLPAPRSLATFARARSSAPQRDFSGFWANKTFEDLGVHPTLVKALAAQNIVQPTVVQADSFGTVVKGRDVVLRAETGSGKTLAFLLPLVNRIYHLHDRAKEAAVVGGPNPLQSSRPWVVLAPTSDLCAQILAMLESIDSERLVAAQSLQRLFRWEALPPSRAQVDHSFQEPCLVERTALQPKLGGSPSFGRRQPAAYAVASPRIRWGATDIVVTTPVKYCEDLQASKDDGMLPACIVMDEADALFHGVSRNYLFDIFAALRPRLKVRQAGEARERLPEMLPTQFIFSAATMLHIGPFSVGNMIIERFCTAHTVETRHFHRLPSGLALENVRWVPGSEDWDRRVEQLVEVLREVPCDRTVVFVNSLHNGHVLLAFLKKAGWPVASFMKGPQGRMGPRFRDAQKFAEGEAPVLIATEFGGRGIDWPDVDHVINFQMPTSTVCWLHRIGRTGRVGRNGLVTNLVASKDQYLAGLIQTRLAADKDLHGAFSRRRSLNKRLRSERADAEVTLEHHAEDGTYRMHGGLELYEESLASTAAQGDRAATGSEGTLLGYLPMDAADDDTGDRKRRRGRPQRGGADAAVTVGDDDDALDEFRRQLLESDSSGSEDEGDPLGGSDVVRASGAGAASAKKPGAAAESQRAFQWSMLEESPSEGAVVAPPSRRRLLNRRRQKDEEDGGGSSRPERTFYSAGARKGFGATTANRAAAARNYAAADDDLLL